MKPFRSSYFIFIFLILVCANAFAEVSIETAVSRTSVPVGDQLIFDIIISNAAGRIEQPSIPAIEGFTSYSQSHSQEISFINGKSSSRSIFSYALVANSVGPKRIGPFDITIDGKTYKVAPVQVEVTQGSQSSASGPSYSWSQAPVVSPSSRALPSGTVGDQDIFVKAWLDKDEVYVNGPVMLTYTLFTRLSATYKGFDKEPVTTGFWVEDFPPDKTIKRMEKIINGSRYVVADVRKLALFPTQAGVYTVDPGILSASVEIRNEESFDNFFSSGIFGRRAFPTAFTSQVIQKTLTTPPVTLTVKALPESGKPEGFSGAVGHYEMENSLDKKEVEAGNPVTFRVRIWGQGNINTIQTPKLPKMNDFKVYDSSSSSHISKERLIVEGEKITETVVVPKKAGTYTIPPLTFSYFDPVTQSYAELKTPVQTLIARPGTEAENESAPSTDTLFSPAAREDVASLAKDIRYIKTMDDGKIPPAEELYKNPLYWTLNLFSAGLYFLLMFFAATKESGAIDLKGLRLKRSHGIAKSKLKAASRYLKEEKKEEFYSEVSRAVEGYFADKLNISAQALSLPQIEKHAGDQMPPELFNKIRALFEELSMGRFARVEKTKDEMKAMYEKADQVITAFERLKIK